MAKNGKQFEHILSLQGVEINYKHKGQTNEIQGISFKKGEYSFKGSEVDRTFEGAIFPESSLYEMLKRKYSVSDKNMM